MKMSVPLSEKVTRDDVLILRKVACEEGCSCISMKRKIGERLLLCPRNQKLVKMKIPVGK